MKKGLIILSNSQFYNVVNFDNSNYQLSKKLILKLGKNYSIDNFSNERLTARAALNFIDIFTEYRPYAKCILALGAADIGKTQIDEFILSYNSIVEALVSKGVEPVIVSLPAHILKGNEAHQFQEAIESIAMKHSLECLSNNSRLVSSYLNKNNMMCC